MGSEKPRHVEKIPNSNFPLQNMEEINFCISGQTAPNHEVTGVNFTGVGALDMPSNMPLQFPCFPSVGVPLTGIDWMTNVSQLDSYKDFMFDSYPISSVENIPTEYCTLGDVAASDGTQMGMLGAEENSFRPQLMGNFGIHGTSRPVLCHAQYGNEIRNIYNATKSAGQSDYPEMLDGSFLTLGVGTNTEVRSFENDMSLDPQPQLNASYEENTYKSHFNEVGGFPSLAQNAGEVSSLGQIDGLESLIQNAGEISSTMLSGDELSSLVHDVSSSLDPVQTVGRFSLSEKSFGVTVGASSSLSSNLLHMLQTSQIDQGELLSSMQQNVGLNGPVQNAGQISSIKPNETEVPNLVHNASRSSSLVQNAGNSLGFTGGANSSLNPNLLHMPPSLQNDQQHHFLKPIDEEFDLMGSRTSRVGYQNPNKGFYSFSCTSSIPHNSNQTTLPGSGQQGMAAWLPLSSFMSQTTKQTSDQLRKFNMGTAQVSQSLASLVSAVGITGNATSQDQSAAVQNHPHSQCTVQTMKGGPLPRKLEVQYVGNICQSQATHHLQASDKLLIHDFTPGQEIPVESISTPYTSNDVARASIKRKVIQPPLVAPHVQCKKTALAAPLSAPVDAPSPPMTQTAHSLPAPHVQSNEKGRAAFAIAPLAWNAPSLPLTQTVHSLPTPQVQCKKNAYAAPPIAPLAKNAPSPPVTQTTHSLRPLICKVPPPSPSLAQVTHPLQSRISTPHVKWQGPKVPQLSGYNCLICKRDLSYTPEGPVLVPSVPPAVAVLACGHCFHDQCLQRITPEDEVKNPPCIPCALGEN
ncbi:hypothetical protein SLEP1_g36139 [Rubroshorea leprosula]|uniref:RING-type domain-containing protein n=1 Tax=Rubroshorea leprosula TaxID=152421 RepID=A0AAV5KQT9_9ROSI|nr:hypothetical protein SLEP1_g36139 [Rubroshorea leprosula]